MDGILAPDMTTEYMTEQVNLLKPTQAKLAQLGLVAWEGITDDKMRIVHVDDEVRILTPSSLDELGHRVKKGSAKSTIVEAPYFPHMTTISAKDLQSIKAMPGQQGQDKLALEEVVMGRVAKMERNYGMTNEPRKLSRKIS